MHKNDEEISSPKFICDQFMQLFENVMLETAAATFQYLK